MSEKIIQEKKYDPQWEEWVSQGNLDTIGYRVVEGLTGARLDQLGKGQYFISTRAHSTLYHHSFGKLTPFYQGLLEKKLLGTRCPRCGFTFLPPRADCWRPECKATSTEWIEMPLEGTLHTYTILGFSSTPFLPALPFILAYVRLDGANTALAGKLVGIDPAEVQCDMRVKANFVDEPKGTPMDIYFTPLEIRPSRRDPEERRRLEKQLGIIHDWVARNFPQKGAERK